MIVISTKEIEKFILDNGHHQVIVETKYIWELAHNIAEAMLQKKLKMKKGETFTLMGPK